MNIGEYIYDRGTQPLVCQTVAQQGQSKWEVLFKRGKDPNSSMALCTIRPVLLLAPQALPREVFHQGTPQRFSHSKAPEPPTCSLN